MKDGLARTAGGSNPRISQTGAVVASAPSRGGIGSMVAAGLFPLVAVLATAAPVAVATAVAVGLAATVGAVLSTGIEFSRSVGTVDRALSRLAGRRAVDAGP